MGGWMTEGWRQKRVIQSHAAKQKGHKSHVRAQPGIGSAFQTFCSSVHLIIRSTELFIHSTDHPIIHSSDHPFIHSSDHSSVHPIIHPFIRSSIQLNCSSIHLIIRSSIHHSSDHPFIRSSIHPIVRSSCFSCFANANPFSVLASGTFPSSSSPRWLLCGQ